MKKKIMCMMILCMCFLSGCTAEYTVDISNEYLYYENVVVSAPKTDLTTEKVTWRILHPLISIYEDSFDKKYYTQSDLSDDKTSKMEFQYKHSADTYPKSMALSMCYDVHGMVIEDDTVLLQTDERFKCMAEYPELTEVIVKINCPFAVERHNADSVDHETYTWVITKDNAEHKPIILKFNKAKKIETKKKSSDKLLDTILIGIGCVFLIIGVIYLINVYNNNQNNNNI